MSAASLVTSVPVMPIAMPMSAALRAGASLTPSPVIATTARAPSAPRRCAACARPRRGRRPSTSLDRRGQLVVVEARRARRRSARVVRRPAMPSSRAIAAAGRGWSPVIMTGRMPRLAAGRRPPSRTSARGGSIIPTRPTKTRSSSTSARPRPAARPWSGGDRPGPGRAGVAGEALAPRPGSRPCAGVVSGHGRAATPAAQRASRTSGAPLVNRDAAAGARGRRPTSPCGRNRRGSRQRSAAASARVDIRLAPRRPAALRSRRR